MLVRFEPSQTTVPVVKLEVVDTCNLYDVAPLAAFQLNVGVSDCPVAPFTGDASVGAAGGLPVVKLHVLDHRLVPAAFFALTRQ